WRLAAWIVFAVIPAQSQPALSFEVATIRPYQRQTQRAAMRDAAQVTYTDVTLADLIMKAYDVGPYQIKGLAAAFDSRRFAVIAKLPEGAAKKDINIMLQH